MLTPIQIKMARIGLDWSQQELAEHAGVNLNTISNIEGGQTNASSKSLKAIHRALSVHWEFLEGDGLKRRTARVDTLYGDEGFTEFRQMVLAEAQKGPLDICVSNVDETHFSRWGGEEMNNQYRQEMAKIKTVTCRILVKEGDKNLVAAHFAEYRWVPEGDFGEIPFYIFNDKAAIIAFENENLTIVIIHHPLIAQFYRTQFEKNWSQARNMEE